MKFVRFEVDGEARYGELIGEEVHELAAPPFENREPTGRVRRRSEIRLLAPCLPSKVLAVGRNFHSHLGDRPAPTEPGLFAKLPSSIIGPDDEIRPPADAEEIHYEGELVVVIGRRTRHVSPHEAAAYIFGVTAGNDVSERRWQRGDLQWLRAKGSDTFGPLGPVIATDLDHGDLLIQTRLNGEVVQSERSRDLIFPIEHVVAYASRYFTLEAGDVIYTGTPGTTSPLAPGDVVEIEVEGVGVLRNRVAPAA